MTLMGIARGSPLAGWTAAQSRLASSVTTGSSTADGSPVSVNRWTRASSPASSRSAMSPAPLFKSRVWLFAVLWWMTVTSLGRRSAARVMYGSGLEGGMVSVTADVPYEESFDYQWTEKAFAMLESGTLHGEVISRERVVRSRRSEERR